MDNRTIKCLFLLPELSGYLVSCLQRLADDYDTDVHVVRWPVNAIAPFEFNIGTNITVYERNEFNEVQLLQLALKINPDIILCSGWMDKGYKKVCAAFNKKIKVVLGIDNPWRGTLKQHIASLAGPLTLHKYYNCCWVPGSSQKKYAVKLGFNENLIKTGAYSCDYDAFHRLYEETWEKKSKGIPHKIIFVGRYTSLKGVLELWEGFTKFQEKNPCDWELWCLGKGEYENKFPVHEKIRNYGFVQPSEMKKFISDCGVFILPSHYEHWGVVVHEFAAAGFPLICTSTTGAAEAFLRDNENGFVIPPANVDALVEVFDKIAGTSQETLVKFGRKSAELAATITPDTWSQTFLSFLKS